MLLKKLLLRGRGSDQARQRMSDVVRIDAVGAKEGFLEGEDAQQAVDRGAHGRQPALAPRPDLRGYQVHARDTQPLQAPGHAQVKVRAVGEDGRRRALRRRGRAQFPVLAVNTGNVRNNFEDADHRQAGRIHHRPDAGRAHFRAGAAEHFEVRKPVRKSRRQRARVQVARGFPCRNQDFRPHYGQV